MNFLEKKPKRFVNQYTVTGATIFPTVHLNGTSQEELLNQLVEAMNGIREADQKLSDSQPNGRDYIQPTTFTFKEAQEQHKRWRDMLKTILDEIYAVSEKVSEQSK